jgi:hypothetical protein
MRTGFVVKQKGYEYNDNWYDHDPSQDEYTNLFNDPDSAEQYAKKFTADFIEGRSVYDYFNGQPYLQDLKNIVGDDFGNYDVNSEEFSKIWSFIKNDIAVILEAELSEGEPTVVTYSDGTKMYYKNNLLHRIGKPAIERGDGNWEYYFEGKKHRIDGPAVYSEYADEGFYVDGKYYWDKDEFNEAVGIWLQKNRDTQISQIIDK